MNTDIRTLQLLERDLEAVASRERARLVSVERHAGGRGPGRPSNRRRGGGHSWGGVAAAVVALLVLAGGIGLLSQGGGGDQASSGGGQAESGFSPTAPPEEGSDGGGGGAAGRANADGETTDAMAGWQEAPGAGYAVDEEAGGGDTRPGVGAVPAEQGDLTKIVRDGRIGIVIDDGSFSKGVAAVTRIARGNGGFVLESSARDERSGTLTLRIPAKRFDDAMLALRGVAGELGGEVEFQDITGEDVTAEFIDLGARLEILQERRDLLLDIQADATTTSEVLRVAGLIEDVQLDIENIQGRLNFLKDQVAEATIRVEVRERDVERQDPGPDPENPSIADSFALALQGFLRVVGAVVVGLGYLIPVAVVAGLGYVVVRLVRRRDRGAS
jgi:hypothetical protein